MSYLNTHISHCCLPICDASIFTCCEHIDALKRKQIRRGLNSFYSPNTEKEIVFICSASTHNYTPRVEFQSFVTVDSVNGVK